MTFNQSLNLFGGWVAHSTRTGEAGMYPLFSREPACLRFNLPRPTPDLFVVLRVFRTTRGVRLYSPVLLQNFTDAGPGAEGRNESGAWAEEYDHVPNTKVRWSVLLHFHGRFSSKL